MKYKTAKGHHAPLLSNTEYRRRLLVLELVEKCAVMNTE
jgi:hypothetical protein